MPFIHESSSPPMSSKAVLTRSQSLLRSYLRQNAALPPEMSPLLEDYLSQLTRSLADMDDEIAEMEAALMTRKEARARLRLERTIYSKIKAPIRQVPPEIWGIVFGHVLATTPGLCTGIEIVLDSWVNPNQEDVQLQLKRKLAPWLAIINSHYPYRL
ncbi:hypothetical protein BKA70DRAFT_1237171 [Coprinopsis sp. MPI-PUGE-AT-0042]|nr:hypothetical protein BKA70DRAFT_1237171 [Coprinopsis sp. MPI-PUGE-AT-0042]